MSVEHDAEEPERIALLPWEETDLWGGADAVSDGAIQARCMCAETVQDVGLTARRLCRWLALSMTRQPQSARRKLL